MILVILAVVCALIAVITAILLNQRRFLIVKPTRVQNVFAVALALCISLSVCVGVLSSSANKLADNLVEENYKLNLYYGPVSSSHNEYVRYDFYNEANAHDKALDSYIESSKKLILKDFYRAEKLEGIQKINFSLRTDEVKLVG